MATRARKAAAPPQESMIHELHPSPGWQAPVGNGALTVTDDEGEPIEETAADRVARMLATVSDDRAKVSIYRIDKSTKKQAWCDDLSVNDYETGGLAMVREKWGPGDYVIRLLAPIANGKAGKAGYAPHAVAHITIDGAPVQAAQQAGSSDMARVLEVMQENQRAFQDQLMQALNNRPDPMANFTQMLAMMSGMREAMGITNESRSGASAVKELLQGLAAIRQAKELIEPDKPAESDSPMAMLGPILEMAKTAMSAQAQQPQGVPMISAPPTLYPAHPEPGPFNPAPIIQRAQRMPEESAPVNPFQAVAALRGAIAPLLDMAANGVSVDQALDYLCSDAIPPEFELVEPMLGEANWFELLCQLVPEARPHEAWLRSVRDAYLALPIGPETDLEADSPAQSINDA